MVQRLVARLGKRRSAWEKTDPREIADVEFQNRSTGGLDLRPSVYVLSAEPTDLRALVVRVRAEHSASLISPPSPNGTIEFDVEGASAAQLQASPGHTKFQFASSVHAELVLHSEAELLRLVATLLAERAARQVDVPGADVMAYVDARLSDNDPEWTAVVGSAGAEHGQWGRAVAAFRKKRDAATWR